MKWACLGLALLVASPVVAAPAVPAVSKEDEREARERYDRGMAEYTVRDFDNAIADFKKAYELTREPGLLFNLGQASRLAKRTDDALYFYRTYLRLSPEAANRADVEEFIEHLSSPTVADAAPPSPLPVPTAVSAPVDPLEATDRQQHARQLKLGLGLGFVGVGAAFLASGIGLGVVSRNDADDVSHSATKGVSWSAALRSQWDEGQRDAKLATAFYVVGGVTAAAGVMLAILSARRWNNRFAAAPLAGGAQLAWARDF